MASGLKEGHHACQLWLHVRTTGCSTVQFSVPCSFPLELGSPYPLTGLWVSEVPPGLRTTVISTPSAARSRVQDAGSGVRGPGLAPRPARNSL